MSQTYDIEASLSGSAERQHSSSHSSSSSATAGPDHQTSEQPQRPTSASAKHSTALKSRTLAPNNQSTLGKAYTSCSHHSSSHSWYMLMVGMAVTSLTNSMQYAPPIHILQIYTSFLCDFSGVGSMWFHASLTVWGGILDSLSIYVYTAFLLLYSLRRRYISSPAFFWVGYLITVRALTTVCTCSSNTGISDDFARARHGAVGCVLCSRVYHLQF
jgi:hypothetical protein